MTYYLITAQDQNGYIAKLQYESPDLVLAETAIDTLRAQGLTVELTEVYDEKPTRQ